jgi:peptidoglycan/xylan/chitin deacetylase (PgdA/CDA1 family)
MWGPEQKPTAISLTFDHLGEAAAIEQNRWPADEPIGRHFSATRVVPRLLEFLGGLGVRATFFVEGWNCAVYPEVLRSIVEAGHEVGYHGWRHESWARLSDADARALLERGVAAFAQVGIQRLGLRAPGGAQPTSTLSLLAEYGFRYFSLPGHAATLYDGLACLTYEWHQIDAFYYSPRLRDLRQARGYGPDAVAPADFQKTLDTLLNAPGTYQTLLFHTQLLGEQDEWSVFEHTLRRLAADPSIWCAPQHELASWMATHPQDYEQGLQLDDASWDPAEFS